MQRLGERYDTRQTYKRRPGAYGIVLRGDAALLTISTELDSEDIQLPGGGIDPGENPIQALHREVMEETGWRIAVKRRLGVYRRFSYLPEYDMWAEKICSIYHCYPVRQLQPPSEPHHSVIWAPKMLVPDILVDPSQSEFLAGRLGSI